LAAVFTILICAPARGQEIYAGKDGSVRNVDARAALASGGDFYLATKSALYRASDGSDRWESVFYLPAGSNEINCLAVSPRGIFVGTKRGLFKSDDKGATWKNVFRTLIPEKSEVLCVNISRHKPGMALIGTRRGVFMSADAGTHWRDMSANLKNRSIGCIAVNKEYIYAGSDGGLYRKCDGSNGWQRLVVKSAADRPQIEAASEETGESEENDAGVGCIAINGRRLYAGAGRKMLYSDDAGKTWSAFTNVGLSGAINYVLPAEKGEALYCATTRGVFEFLKEPGTWKELYKGKDRNFNAKWLRADNEGSRSLWAATDKGLYRLEAGAFEADGYVDIEKSLRLVKVSFDSEPGFTELQQAAIKYADVDPEKIKKWHTESRMRALLPKVSVGLDRNRSTNYEIYTSSTKEYVTIGPDDITDGWDVSVSWELGDLIWSDDQTNIDVRSRLMVQLRNDILDDLRRAYYERKRLQFELMSAPPADAKAGLEKEMRIQELTQTIDDLTGNYFSEKMRREGR
jgi:photosystem II stability/assembly factor-like uncharacterized protein